MTEFKEELLSSIREHDRQCKLHRKHRSAAQQHRKHLQYLADSIKSYPPPAYNVISDGKGYVRRLYNSKCKKSRASAGKTVCSKQVRKYQGCFPKGNYYRKVYDYWWTLW